MRQGTRTLDRLSTNIALWEQVLTGRFSKKYRARNGLYLIIVKKRVRFVDS